MRGILFADRDQNMAMAGFMRPICQGVRFTLTRVIFTPAIRLLTTTRFVVVICGTTVAAIALMIAPVDAAQRAVRLKAQMQPPRQGGNSLQEDQHRGEEGLQHRTDGQGAARIPKSTIELYGAAPNPATLNRSKRGDSGNSPRIFRLFLRLSQLPVKSSRVVFAM